MILSDTNIFIEIYRDNVDIIKAVKAIGQHNIAVSDVNPIALVCNPIAPNRPRLQRGRLRQSFVTIIINKKNPYICVMAGDKYSIGDQNGVYYTTSTIISWIDVFTRISYKEIITKSLNYCIENKGLKIYAWVLMSNHLHLVCRAKEGFQLSEILRDFKKFASKQIIEEIKTSNESRAEWLLDKFAYEAKKTGRAENYKVWQDANHAIEIGGFIYRRKNKLYTPKSSKSWLGVSSRRLCV